MEDLQEFSEHEESNFDLKTEIYKYLSHWRWLLLGSLVGLLMAYLYTRYNIPEYRSEATMMVLDEQQSNIMGSMPSGSSSFLQIGENSLDNQIETLKSKRLVQNVVRELKLNITYHNPGKVIAVEAYKNSSIILDIHTPDSIVNEMRRDISVIPVTDTSFTLEEDTDKKAKRYNFGQVINHKDLDFTVHLRHGQLVNLNPVNIRILPLTQVANNYISRMEIKPKGEAKDILALAINGEVQEKSEDFLNALIRHFNLDGIADKRQVAENTAQFIQERLQLITNELDSVEDGMADFKRDNRIMSVETSAGQYSARSSLAEEEIFRLETQKMVIQSVQQKLTSSEPYRLLPSNLGVDQSGVTMGVDNYNNMVLQRDSYLQTSTSENPIVQNITSRLESMRSNLLQSIESTLSGINIQLRELAQLEQMAEGQFSTFPGMEKGIRNIERQQLIKEQLYLFLLQRREETAISFAATSPVAKIIDPAYSQALPIGPESSMLLMGGFLIGLFLPVGVIFVGNMMDTKVHNKRDLNTVIRHIPFLGEIPRIGNEENSIIELNDRSSLAESFRMLRTNLAYMIQSRNKLSAEVIFVTSSIKGEGKTFISFNLTRTLASTSKKVLLVGADIRNPKLHHYSGASVDTKGLSDYLYDYNTQLSDIIRPLDEGNILIDVIFSGGIPPNPAELFMNERMEVLLNEAKKLYDYIIVDTAPTMIVTDTLLISPLADSTLYVVRAGYTEKKLLEFPLELKQQGKLQGLAIILNDVDFSKASYGSKYGYNYGYGYGYEADKKKKSIFPNPFKKKNNRVY